MKKVLFTAIALLALLPAIVSATTYYIDATGGNDGWSGTTQSTPWKTISKVNSATFNPGDQILFKRGETWREQLNVPSSGTEGKPITFGAYGSGEKPKIHNTILINKGNWTQIDRNIWKIKLSPIIKRSIIIDNERCNFVNSIGDLSKDKDVYYDNDSSYYVWNAVSPELDSRFFEWIRFYNVGRPAIFVSSKDYITFKNLSLRGGDGYHAC